MIDPPAKKNGSQPSDEFALSVQNLSPSSVRYRDASRLSPEGRCVVTWRGGVRGVGGGELRLGY